MMTRNSWILSVLFFYLVWSPAYAVALPAQCESDCASAYGVVLGKSPSGVEAYSNCNSSCVVFEPSKYKGTYTGIKWQCVEYARRWLLVNAGVVYGDVDVAVDIWNKIDHVTTVPVSKKFKLAQYVNGSAVRPRKGDLLIYAREYLNTGHVAVITAVDKGAGFVKVAEQNFLNNAWPGDFARKIPFIKREGNYWLMDAYLLGWKRVIK